MRRFLLLMPLLVASATLASEVPDNERPGWVPPQNRSYQSQPWYSGQPRYYDPPPRYIPAPPRVQFGDTCAVYDSARSCDLRRPAPLNSYCECISPSGRAREGRVVR